jgi:hypothetical protein
MTGSTSLLTYKSAGPVKLLCEIDIAKLLPTKVELQRFESNWQPFLDSCLLGHSIPPYVKQNL